MKFLLLAQLLLTPIDTGRIQVIAKNSTLTDTTIIRVLPIPITRVIADQGGSCDMVMFRDSSFVMRSEYKTDTTCIRKYGLIPEAYKKVSGYYQRRVDTMCLYSDNLPGCDVDTMRDILMTTSPWPVCTGSSSVCGIRISVMDFNSKHTDQYANGVYRCDRRGTFGVNDPTDNCVATGWSYPYKPFPGYYETASMLVFFIRTR